MISEKDILEMFPAKEFRTGQKETLLKMANAFNSGYRAILLDAPTGTGKSLINTTFARILEPAFYATPQLQLIEQIRFDRNIGKYYTEIRGRQNYYCKYDPASTCDVGLCYRIRDFKCQKTEVCPYWKAKVEALGHPRVLMSFSYLILEGFTESAMPYTFGSRKLLILDEAHSIDKYILNHFSIEISPYSLPEDVYEKAMIFLREPKDMDETIDIMDAVIEIAQTRHDDYEMMTLDGKELTLEDAYEKKKLDDFLGKCEIFATTYSKNEWICDFKYTKTQKGLRKVLRLQPLYARAIARDVLWYRGEYIIISSATILDPNKFVFETGLDNYLDLSEIIHIKVPSTFPPENRPIIDAIDGKLVYTSRSKNLPLAVKILERILDIEKDVNVLVHCHSYDIARAIENLIDPKYKERLITHLPENRKEAFEEFKRSRGKVFLSVAFEEGYDLIYDMCRAQVLFKVPYPDINDRRVARRLEKKEYDWYYLEALKTTIQSYGRAVRAPDDYARFYVIDASFIDLIKRTRHAIPNWFVDALPVHWKKLVGRWESGKDIEKSPLG